MIKLYFREKTRAVRPRWLLEELGLEYELHRVDIFAGEGREEQYRQVHPLGQIPAIEIEGETQFESGAICHLLADRHSQQGLAPALDSPERAAYEQWFFYAVSSMDPPAFQVALHSLLLPEDMRIPEMIPLANRSYRRTLPILEAHLKDRPYLMGADFSAADIMVGSVLMWLPRALQDFPTLKAYVKRLRARQAYQRAATKLAS